ncbi:hypothetical protein [Streptomyces sp. NPDC001292]|uniref:hypothetical protein n=1 Tax=Streptomyces sp. NPDC001292 TaxID=3364558 RepID=UPI0036D0CEDC
MEDAAEAIGSSYVEAGCLAQIRDRRGREVQRAAVGDALVRTVFVEVRTVFVEPFELAQGLSGSECTPCTPRTRGTRQRRPKWRGMRGVAWPPLKGQAVTNVPGIVTGVRTTGSKGY